MQAYPDGFVDGIEDLLHEAKAWIRAQINKSGDQADEAHTKMEKVCRTGKLAQCSRRAISDQQLLDMVVTSSQKILCEEFGWAGLDECREDWEHARNPPPREVSRHLWCLTEDLLLANAQYCCKEFNGGRYDVQKAKANYENTLKAIRETPFAEFREEEDLFKAQETWKANWDRLADLSREQHKDSQEKRNHALKSESRLHADHLHPVYSYAMLMEIDEHEEALKDVIAKCDDTDVKMKSHLRSYEFMLTGKHQRPEVKIVDKSADDAARVFQGMEQRFVRALVTVPSESFPTFGGSRYISTKPNKGVLVTPTLPVDFKDFWEKKADGYRKFGPTFVQYMKPSMASQSEHDTMKVTHSGKTVTVPLPDKVVDAPPCKRERVVIRSRELHLRNLQRMKLTFPRKSKGTMLFEIIDGYVERIKFADRQLDITLLIPHQENLIENAHPFGEDHPGPRHFDHHHNNYSRVFNVEPVSGQQLIHMIDNERHGTLSFEKGAVMEYNIVGIAGACGAVCACAGAVIGTAKAVSAVKDACK